VNAEGRAQSFVGVVKPQGEARPAWKVLRVLGTMLGLQGFEFDSSEQVRMAALGLDLNLLPRMDNSSKALAKASAPAAGLERIADVPIYASDALVRHATSLQLTADARKAPFAGLPTALWSQLGLTDGDQVIVTQGSARAQLPARQEAALPANVVRVPAGLPETAALGGLFGALTIAKV
jgi:NADH-quinone oxidoreductase subunit G